MRNSQGIHSLAATLLFHALDDFETAPQESAAYRSAHRLLRGGECSHLVCSACVKSSANGDWRSGECPPASDSAIPCQCGHGWDQHVVMTFDWSEYRDTLLGASGIHLTEN